jgi:hypothetical protein
MSWGRRPSDTKSDNFDIKEPLLVVDPERFYRSGVKRVVIKHEIRNPKIETNKKSKIAPFGGAS